MKTPSKPPEKTLLELQCEATLAEDRFRKAQLKRIAEIIRRIDLKIAEDKTGKLTKADLEDSAKNRLRRCFAPREPMPRMS